MSFLNYNLKLLKSKRGYPVKVSLFCFAV